MSRNPEITVYIPCKDYGKFLEKSINSVIDQSFTSWELFIINEGSKDKTSSISKKYQKKFPDKIFFIDNKKPTGLQKLANKVLSLAKGRFIIRLDADDWFDENALLVLYKKIESRKSYNLVYGNFFYCDIDGKIIDVEIRQQLTASSKSVQLPPHGACTLIRARTLKSVGGYSEDVDAQDGWDLWYKVSKRSEVACVETPVFYYRQHPTSLSTDNDRLLKARAKIFKKITENTKGDYQFKVLAVIPVKESYPGFKGIPYQPINGVSLLEHIIKIAEESQIITDIAISSENNKVISFASNLMKEGKVKKHLLCKRGKFLDATKMPLDLIVKNAAEKYFENYGHNPDIVTYLNLHSINRTCEHIDTSLETLKVTESDTNVSVTEIRDPVFSYKNEGLNLTNPGRFRSLSFDDERLYMFNGSHISSWWDSFVVNGMFGKKITFIEMTSNDSIKISSNNEEG